MTKISRKAWVERFLKEFGFYASDYTFRRPKNTSLIIIKSKKFPTNWIEISVLDNGFIYWVRTSPEGCTAILAESVFELNDKIVRESK